MSAEGDKFRNRPDEDYSTRRTAEDELMRGDQPQGDRGVGQTGGGSAGGSGTAGGGIENEGTGSLLVNAEDAEQQRRQDDQSSGETSEEAGSGSTKGGSAPGVSGKRGMTGGMEKEGEGHSGPIRSGEQSTEPAHTEQDRAAAGNDDTNAREGYEDHGSSRDADGTQGESSGSRPGYVKRSGDQQD